MKILIAIFLCGAILQVSPSVLAQTQTTTLSPTAVEGILSFQTTVFMPPAVTNNDANVGKLISLQDEHLLSVFELPGFAKMNGIENPAANSEIIGLGARQGYQVVNQVKTLDGTEITYKVLYRAVVNKNFLASGETKPLKIILPHDPVEIYSRTCTDGLHPAKADFFYYWNPFAIQCVPWLKGKNKVDLITAQVTGLQSLSSKASPDYPLLQDQVKQRGSLRVALLFDGELSKSYDFFNDSLTKAGFKSQLPDGVKTGSFADLTKTGVLVSLSLNDADSVDDNVFYHRVREAFETADVVIYRDHGALGGSLDLDAIARHTSPDPRHPIPIRFPDAYQILFLDGSHSYYFYSQNYNLTGRGVHHADVISNGTAAFPQSEDKTLLSFINSFVDSTKSPTWLQVLADFGPLTNVSAVR